ncbi:recombinase family protein [Auritidibacter sp. NML130574]|uniref:recombinase family protein n=1 Tax=Auritidibacter sp. NML130574 TaxID=2170745 RepID=UPI001FEEF2C9|nr:recombinase family protein [Auritidibacter sp. NML130574]
MGQNEQEQTTGSVSPLRAVVYVRISDDPESTERGVDRQEADCRAYAIAHGWEVAAVFRAMLKHLSDGQAQVMVAYDLDRAVRDPRDLEDLIDAKVLAGFTVRTVTGSLRLNTDSDVARPGCW